MQIHTILAPVDFSDRARLGVRESAAIASRFNAKLLLLHAVVSGSPSEYQGGEAPGLEEAYDAEALAHLVEREAPAADSELIVLPGELSRSVRRICEERAVDLVVMPTHGDSPYRQYLLGSNTAKVLHDVACPVLTGAHLEHPAEACYPYKRIACLPDLKDSGQNVVSYGRGFAATFGAELLLAYIGPDFHLMGTGAHQEFVQTLEASARLRLERLAEQEGIEAQIRIESGEFEERLPRLLRERDVDLLVIGRGAGGSSEEGGLSASAYAAIRCSPCPVLSV
ncbi:MAG: universal stress protein [Bryobacterales bacterium]